MDTFDKWVARRANQVEPCNCGGPQYGTAHSPDCAFVVSMDNLWQDYKDEQWEKGEVERLRKERGE